MRVFIFQIYDKKYKEIRKQNQNCYYISYCRQNIGFGNSKSLKTAQKRLGRNNACDVIVGTHLTHAYKIAIACIVIEKPKAQIKVIKPKKCR